MRIYARKAPRIRDSEDWMDDRPHLPGLTVFEPDASEPIRTGLYDASGVEIIALEVREPVGFVKLKER